VKGFVADEPPHLVQIRLNHSALDYLLSRIRMWLDQQPAHPKTFRYSFDEPEIVVQVQFFWQAQASAFAQAFGGEVLKPRGASPRGVAIFATQQRPRSDGAPTVRASDTQSSD
jgi:hypothetical protein